MKKSDIEQLADELLLHLRRKPNIPFAWEKLERRLEVERHDIELAARQLAEWNYHLRVARTKGITFVSAPDVLTATEIGYKLKTESIGHDVRAFKSIRSTNDLASELAQSGADEGTIVTSEEQTEGRGRLGRRWHSPPGTGIYVSIILKPRFKPEQAPGLSLMTAVALADTIEKYCPRMTRIKWPNDVLIAKRKTAGILTELSADRDRIHFVIVGVGINVNQGVGSFPDELRSSATSIRRYLRRKVNRIELLQRFLVNFEREYALYAKHGLTKSRRKLLKYSSLIGKEVTLDHADNRLIGKAINIDESGRLILETELGRHAITAGEVTVVKR